MNGTQENKCDQCEVEFLLTNHCAIQRGTGKPIAESHKSGHQDGVGQCTGIPAVTLRMKN